MKLNAWTATLALIGTGLFSAARAGADEPGERAEALVMGAAVNRFVAKQMPATFQIPGERASGIAPLAVTLSEARYCGAIDAGHGRLVSIGRPGKDVAAVDPPTLTARDCQDKLDQVAHRLLPGTESVAVIEIVVEWAPSPPRLRFMVGDVATGGTSGAALGVALARARASGPLETINTAGIALASQRGAALELDLAVSFVKEGDAILATLTPAGPGRGGRDPRPSLVDPAGAPAGTDAIAGAAFPLANRVIALLGQDGPLVLDLQGQSVEVRRLEVSGGSDLLVVRGRATLRSMQESVRLAIHSTGADLKIAEIRAEPETEDCAALTALAALSCRARNTARAAAVAALASSITTRYQGQLLRSLIAPPALSFDLGRRRVTLRLAPTRARATNQGVVVYGRADLN